MSAFGGDVEVLPPVALRSSTPPANEKVLLYLEGMHRAETASAASKASEPPRLIPPSVMQGDDPSRRSSNGKQLDDLAKSQVSYATNEQDGKRSELGTAMPLPEHEPGPNDPPGARYESFDSGPSFGNFGPLPRDSQQKMQPWTSWTPNLAAYANTPARAAGIPLPDGSVRSPTIASRQVPHPASAAPPSARSPSIGIDIQAPTALGSAKAQSPPLTQKSRSIVNPQSPKVAQKPDRPFSPTRTAMTGKSRGAAYPPLPESDLGEDDYKSHHRAPSRAYSLSPSDSPSQPAKPKRSAPTPKPRDMTIPEESASPRSNGSRLPSFVPATPPQTHHSRPFSPYRHEATQHDLLAAAAAGAAYEKALSAKAPSARAPSARTPSAVAPSHAGSYAGGSRLAQSQLANEQLASPAHTAQGPEALNPEEEQIVRQALTPYTRTSFAATSALEPEIAASHYHDTELCVLLHQVDDPTIHEYVKKALRKAIRQRVKKLGLKYDNESIKQYRKSFHDHDPSVHMNADYDPSLAGPDAPLWAQTLMEGMQRMQVRLDKLTGLKSRSTIGGTVMGDSQSRLPPETFQSSDVDRYQQTPRTQTVNIQTQPTDTVPAESMMQPADEGGFEHEGDQEDLNGDELEPVVHETPRAHTHSIMDGRDDSPGQQYLEEELYKLRVKPGGSDNSHHTWEVAPEDDGEEDDPGDEAFEQPIPEIPDSGDNYTNRPPSPPLPPIPQDSNHRSSDLVHLPQGQVWNGTSYTEFAQPPPWQKIHQRLLSWAIIWPMYELDQALNSTTRGMQIDDVALSVWSAQTYKRYVRAKMTDVPSGKVDRLFVPPNMADAINTAVFNGRHGDAGGMLRDLWIPFGLEGLPRLIIVLAKHRSDSNHWVVHRFSIPDAALTTYDSYPEKTLPDGRPLGWWFAIRAAWVDATYPHPDHLVQKVVRLHRPMQLGIDNSVAAAGIWRNLLMGSRAERSLDLERLRDLINTEVKNLRLRKEQGKLTVGGPKPNWVDMH